MDNKEKEYVSSYRIENNYEYFYTENEAMKERIYLFKKYDRALNIVSVICWCLFFIGLVIFGATGNYYTSSIWITCLIVAIIIDAILFIVILLLCNITDNLEYVNFFKHTQEFEDQYKEYIDSYEKERQDKLTKKAEYLTDMYTTLDNSEYSKEKKVELISNIIDDYENK